MIITERKYFAKAASLTLASIFVTSITYSFLYFNLILLPSPSEMVANSTNMLSQYKNLIAIFYGLILFLGFKYSLRKKDNNPFTGIQLGIMIFIPAVLTTVFLIPYSLS